MGCSKRSFSIVSLEWPITICILLTKYSSSAVSGQLPTAPFDWTIDRACELGNIYTLPDALRFKLIVQRYCHRVSKAMCSISYDCMSPQTPPPGEPSSFMMSWQNDMAAFESELDILEQENGPQFSGKLPLRMLEF